MVGAGWAGWKISCTWFETTSFHVRALRSYTQHCRPELLFTEAKQMILIIYPSLLLSQGHTSFWPYFKTKTSRNGSFGRAGVL